MGLRQIIISFEKNALAHAIEHQLSRYDHAKDLDEARKINDHLVDLENAYHDLTGTWYERQKKTEPAKNDAYINAEGVNRLHR